MVANGYIGVTKNLNNLDWSSKNAIQLWTVPDGKKQKVVVQLQSDSNVFEVYLNLYPAYNGSTTPVLVTVPFSSFVGRDNKAAVFNPSKIQCFGLWCNTIVPEGQDAASYKLDSVLYYDDIKAVTSDAKDVTFTPAGTNTDSAITPSTEIFNTLSPVDIKTTMTLNGNTLVNIMSGTAPLTKSDYSVNGNVVTINKSFFSYYFNRFGKFKNDCILTFKFSSGKDASFTVKPIFDALLSPDTLTYDPSKPSDVKVTMAISGNTLASIMSGAASLSKADYSVNGNIATINKSFFNYYFSRFNNNCSLKFVFSDGKYAILTVKPYYANNPSISPDMTTCNVSAPENIKVTMTLNGYTFLSVMNGSSPLSKYDYSINGNVVTINKGYFAYYFGKFGIFRNNCILTFKFSNGKEALLTVKPDFSAPVLSPNTTTCNVSAPEDIKITMNLNRNTLVNIMNGAAPLSKVDYSVNGNVVTINKGYFAYYFGRFGIFKNNCILTFKLSDGKDATLTVKPIF